MHQESSLHLSIKDFSTPYHSKVINGVHVHQSLLSRLDEKIYKYIETNYLLQLLESKKLYIANRTTFKDRREQGIKENKKKMCYPLPAKFETLEQEEWGKEYLIKLTEAYKICISCWTRDIHENCDESITNWNCYGTNTCRIQTTIRDLLENMNCANFAALIAPVKYSQEKIDDIENSIFRKYIAYQDEQEIRLCLLSLNHYENVEVNVEKMIKAIRLSPSNSNAYNKIFSEGTISLFPFLKNKIEVSHIIENL